MAAHACNLSTWKMRQEGLEFKVIFGWRAKFETSLGYLKLLSQKINPNKKQTTTKTKRAWGNDSLSKVSVLQREDLTSYPWHPCKAGHRSMLLC